MLLEITAHDKNLLEGCSTEFLGEALTGMAWKRVTRVYIPEIIELRDRVRMNPMSKPKNSVTRKVSSFY